MKKLLLMLLLLNAKLFGEVVNLDWNDNAETDLAGYRVYYGTASRTYTTTLQAGMTSNYQLTITSPGTYYFAVTAYNTANKESTFSNEVSKTLTGSTTGTIYINFQPSLSPVPSGYTKNDGSNWSAPLDSRDRGTANADNRLSTFVFTAANSSSTLNIPLTNGNYLISLSSGDASYSQGPHKISVEGQMLVNSTTNINQFTTVINAPITVNDSNLTVVLSATTGNAMLNYLIITPLTTLQIPSTPVNLNVQ